MKMSRWFRIGLAALLPVAGAVLSINCLPSTHADVNVQSKSGALAETLPTAPADAEDAVGTLSADKHSLTTPLFKPPSNQWSFAPYGANTYVAVLFSPSTLSTIVKSPNTSTQIQVRAEDQGLDASQFVIHTWGNLIPPVGGSGGTTPHWSAKTVDQPGVKSLEYLIKGDQDEYTTGNPTVGVGTILKIKALPDRATPAWNSSNPTWEIVSKPTGSAMSAPSSGLKEVELTFDVLGTYQVKASCGASSATMQVLVKTFAINIVAIDANQQRTQLQRNLLRDTMYFAKAKLVGGTPNKWGTVTFSRVDPAGAVGPSMPFTGPMTTIEWDCDFDCGHPPQYDWTYASNLRVDAAEDGGGNVAMDTKYVTIHRDQEWDINSVGWNSAGYVGQWQIFQTLPSGCNITQSTNVNEIYSISTSVSLSASCTDIMKNTIGFTHTWNVQYQTSVGSGTSVTTSIPAAPANKWWGVFSNLINEEKTVNVYVWSPTGSQSLLGILTLRRKRAVCGHSGSASDTAAGANSNYPI